MGIFYPDQLFRPGSRVVVDQEAGLWLTKQRRVVSRSWLILSVCPLDWGWKPEDRLTEAPTRLQNSFQNIDVNWGPWSETMSVGSPWKDVLENKFSCLKQREAWKWELSGPSC